MMNSSNASAIRNGLITIIATLTLLPSTTALSATAYSSGYAAEPAYSSVQVAASQASSVTANAEPALVSAAANPIAFTQVEAGSYYSFGLRADGTVWAWGRNMFGELGLPGTTEIGKINAPVRLADLTDIVDMTTSGSGYQLGVKKDGTVWEWGESFGISRETQAPRRLDSLAGVKKVATNHLISLAVKEDGTVWAWMRDAETGQAGETIQAQGLTDIDSAVISGNDAYALDHKGQVFTFSAETQDGSLQLSSPSRIDGLPSLKQIAGSYDTLYGIDKSGQAWKWERDSGTGVPESAGKATAIFPNLKVKAIDGSLLLTDEGEVWSYGMAPYSKDGKVNGLNRMTSIATGGIHSLAIDSQGQIWGWGANQWYETGTRVNNADSLVYSPKRMPNPISVKVNGNVLSTSYPSIMENSLISVPLKDIARALNAELSISTTADSAAMFVITSERSTASFQYNQLEAVVNGKQVNLSSQVYAANGATMIPVSLLRQMGYTVSWNSSLSELNISG